MNFPLQTLYRRYAQRVEQAAALDPPPLRGGSRRNGGAPEPAAAYGPPGGSGAGAGSKFVTLLHCWGSVRAV